MFICYVSLVILENGMKQWATTDVGIIERMRECSGNIQIVEPLWEQAGSVQIVWNNLGEYSVATVGRIFCEIILER